MSKKPKNQESRLIIYYKDGSRQVVRPNVFGRNPDTRFNRSWSKLAAHVAGDRAYTYDIV